MGEEIPVNDEKHFIDCIIWLRDNAKEYAIRIEKVYKVLDWKWCEINDFEVPNKDRIEKLILKHINNLSYEYEYFTSNSGGIEVGISENRGPYIIFTYEMNSFSMCKESYYEEREE